VTRWQARRRRGSAADGEEADSDRLRERADGRPDAADERLRGHRDTAENFEDPSKGA
jgi:hypothetical protein